MTNLTELIRIDSKQSLHVTQLFANCWLSRYPCPNLCLHDNGGEFTGHPFQALLLHHNIKDVPTTVKTLNQMQFVKGCTRLLPHCFVPCLKHTPSRIIIKPMIDTVLAKATYSLRSTHNCTLGMLTGGLVFQT